MYSMEQQYTFARRQGGGWSSKGPRGNSAGDVVNVTKRSGEVRKIELGDILFIDEKNDCTYYSLGVDVERISKSSDTGNNTWTKYADEWAIRINDGKTYKQGDSISVVKKDGTAQSKTVYKIVASGKIAVPVSKANDGSCPYCGHDTGGGGICQWCGDDL